MDYPSSLPASHRAFLHRAIPILAGDQRILAVAAGGSYADDAMDMFSDIDLVMVCDQTNFVSLLQDRTLLASRLGPLAVAFTGEHVGEPRLLICLYGPPALHVDIKVVTLADLSSRAEDLVVLWTRSGIMTEALSNAGTAATGPDAQWIEDRFWVWVHYGAVKIARGELQEALDFLSYLRVSVLGPLGLQRHGLKPYGVRRVEKQPRLAAQLAATVGQLDRPALYAALESAVKLYLELRPSRVEPRADAQKLALDYFQQVQRQFAD